MDCDSNSGYTPPPRPTYQFRGRGCPKEESPSPTPSPEPPKFTFQNIRYKYRPNRIRWTRNDDHEEGDGSDDADPVFTFQDEASDGTDSGDRRESERADKLKHLLSDLLGSEATDSREESEEIDVPRKSLRTSSLTEMGWSYSVEVPQRGSRKKKQYKVVVEDDGFYENEEPSMSSTLSQEDPDDLLFDFSVLKADLKRASNRK